MNSAVELSLYIRDVDFIRQCFDKIKFNQPEYVIKFAELLIDELCAGKRFLFLIKLKMIKPLIMQGFVINGLRCSLWL